VIKEIVKVLQEITDSLKEIVTVLKSHEERLQKLEKR